MRKAHCPVVVLTRATGQPGEREVTPEDTAATA
jgi:hypothetical protein